MPNAIALVIDDPTTEVGNGQARVEPQRLIEVFDRPAILAEFGIGAPEVVVGKG